MTLSELKDFGANVEEGMTRCMNNEAFYLRLVKKAAGDKGFEALKDALEKNDLNAAFEAAHGLKGILGNLSLTPLYTVVSEMTELLRAHKELDYAPYLESLLEAKARLDSICGD